MTSVFYDVIRLSLFADSTACLYKAIFDSFGKFEPQYVVGHRVDPKRHFLTSQLTTHVLSYCASKSIHGWLQ